MQRVHGSLLQRSHQMMDADRSHMMDMSQLPLALREAAFFESADCYTAMIANREVGSRQPQDKLNRICYSCHRSLQKSYPKEGLGPLQGIVYLGTPRCRRLPLLRPLHCVWCYTMATMAAAWSWAYPR